MVQERRNKIYSYLLILTLVISVFSHVFIFGPIIIVSADPGDVSDSYYNATQLNVTVLQLEPRINWYDLQNATGASMLNAQLDVNQEYYFRVNISSDQGWSEIDYVNISCWHDLGNDASTYNGTLGGNINMQLQYINTSGTGTFQMLWPNSEATLGSCSEVNVTGSDPGGSPSTETYNLTFAFTPGYQFRYAPDPSNTGAGFDDAYSWNFNITADDDLGYHSYNNPTIGESTNETGVYSYTEIVSAGWPEITGNPGDNPAYNDSYISITTRSNGNYTLSVNVTNLTHDTQPGETIQNTSIWTAGGDLSPLTQFAGSHQYYYGAGFHAAEDNATSLSTTDIEWGVTIPLGQFPGTYQADIFYHLRTQT